MPPATGLVLIKKFEYRDNQEEEWSNKYWFTGPIPADDTAWQAFATEIMTAEVPCYTSRCTHVRAYGYDNSDEHSPTVWVKDWASEGGGLTGTLPIIADHHVFAGDQAGMIFWKTSRRNSRGKWIYLRKFMHDGIVTNIDPDALGLTCVGAYGTFATKLSDGTLSAGRRIRSAAQDETITDRGGSNWVTTRSLKRRGKRPPLVAGP